MEYIFIDFLIDEKSIMFIYKSDWRANMSRATCNQYGLLAANDHNTQQTQWV